LERCAQAVDGAHDGCLEWSDGGQRAGQLRLGARRVEFGAAPGVQAHLGELQRLALVVHIAACHRELRLLTAQFEVRTGDLGRDRYLGVAQRGLGALHLCALRFDIAAHATEEVELPERIEPGVVEAPVAASFPVGAFELVLDVEEPYAGRGRQKGDRKLRLATLGACLDQMPERNAQVVVGIQA
jgi:hypothetical protein